MTLLATHICDSHSRLYSRLTFTTRIRDCTQDSRSRLPIAPPTATRYFLSRLPFCDPSTDGRTVLTPQHHLPSVPTLTQTKKQCFWNLLPGLASTSSYYLPTIMSTTPSGLVSGPPPPPLPGPLPTSPPLLPLCPSLHPSCLGTCH